MHQILFDHLFLPKILSGWKNWTIQSVRDHGGLQPGQVVEAVFNPDYGGQKKRLLNLRIYKVEQLPEGECKIWFATAEAEDRPYKRPPKEKRCPIVIVPRDEWDAPR